MPQAVFHGTREELRRILHAIPGILAGRANDPYRIAQGVQLRMATALLSKIQQDFLVKSRGGRGSDGIKWPPLSPYTIANRRQGPGDKKAVRLSQRASGFSESETRAIEKRIRDRTRDLMRLYQLKESQALGLARAQVEYQGRKIGLIRAKFAVLSGRTVDILRDTSRLLRSLTPGVEDRTPTNPDQVIKLGVGELIVGTNVFYAAYHQSGTPKMPARRLWPADGHIPEAWLPDILEAGVTGIADAIMIILGR